MVDCGGLENRWARKGPGGSNPSLSAISVFSQFWTAGSESVLFTAKIGDTGTGRAIALWTKLVAAGLDFADFGEASEEGRNAASFSVS